MTNISKIKKVEKVFEWCKKHYKKSKYYKVYPVLVFTYTEAPYFAGEFRVEELIDGVDEVQIIIHLNNIKTVNDIATTVIHEYVHYLQSPTWLNRYYQTTEYKDNPYEKKAEKEANLSYKKCIKETKI